MAGMNQHSVGVEFNGEPPSPAGRDNGFDTLEGRMAC
jgi:hypothetical protein